MGDKIKTQKGFIQIPLLVMVIASIVIASVGTGVVLHKQGKLSSFTVNISEILKEPKNITGEELKTEEEIITEKTSESEIISEPEIKELQTQSQNLQNELQTTKQQLEQTQRQLKQIRDKLESTQKAQKLTEEKARQEVERANAEAEKAKDEQLKKEAERTNRLTEEQRKQGELRKQEEERQREIDRQQELERQRQLEEQRRQEEEQKNDEWIIPISARAFNYTVWGNTWYTGPPEFAIDSNNITAWTLNEMGEIIFDLGGIRTIKGIEAYWGGSVTNGNTVNIFVDDTQVLYNEKFGATSNKRYFNPTQGRYIKYQTVSLPHNVLLQVATWSEIAEFRVLIESE